MSAWDVIKKTLSVPLDVQCADILGLEGSKPDIGIAHPKVSSTAGKSNDLQYQINKPAKSIPEGGQLGEITLATRKDCAIFVQGWQPFYRLYYQTIHWITDIVEGPTEGQWHARTNPGTRSRMKDCVCGISSRQNFVRLIQPDELAPISPHVPADEKHLQVSIENQNVIAFEGDQPVFQTSVSTGRHTEGPTINGIPTDTPLGRFHIGNKMPSRHMGDGTIDSDIYAYELPGVPWNMFFVSTGVAFHGAYWHDNFGYRMSAGCVNLRPEDAKWLYRWTTPVLSQESGTAMTGTHGCCVAYLAYLKETVDTRSLFRSKERFFIYCKSRDLGDNYTKCIHHQGRENKGQIHAGITVHLPGNFVAPSFPHFPGSTKQPQTQQRGQNKINAAAQPKQRDQQGQDH